MIRTHLPESLQDLLSQLSVKTQLLENLKADARRKCKAWLNDNIQFFEVGKKGEGEPQDAAFNLSK